MKTTALRYTSNILAALLLGVCHIELRIAEAVQRKENALVLSELADRKAAAAKAGRKHQAAVREHNALKNERVSVLAAYDSRIAALRNSVDDAYRAAQIAVNNI